METQMERDAERSPEAKRMARFRQRHREGLRPIRIDVRASEIDALVARGLLASERRDDPYEIAGALGRFLDKVLRKP
jgi:hypothetical protein